MYVAFKSTYPAIKCKGLNRGTLKTPLEGTQRQTSVSYASTCSEPVIPCSSFSKRFNADRACRGYCRHACEGISRVPEPLGMHSRSADECIMHVSTYGRTVHRSPVDADGARRPDGLSLSGSRHENIPCRQAGLSGRFCGKMSCRASRRYWAPKTAD